MKDSECRSRVVTLERPYHFLSPFSGEEFAAMIWVVDKTIRAEEQAHLSRELVKQKCRYAVCAGDRCSAWDDSIDMAFLETEPCFQPPDEGFVMTTWHEGEHLQEIAAFFVLNTAFDSFVPKNFLVLLIGRDETLAREAAKVVRDLLKSV